MLTYYIQWVNDEIQRFIATIPLPDHQDWTAQVPRVWGEAFATFAQALLLRKAHRNAGRVETAQPWLQKEVRGERPVGATRLDTRAETGSRDAGSQRANGESPLP